MDRPKVKERTRQAYNKVGSDYDSWYWFKKAKELRAGLKDEVIGLLKKELSEKPRILDLCCGTGYLAKDLSTLGDYAGVDFAPSMIRHCSVTFPKSKFLVGDAEELPFKSSTFDAVVCFWSFHHFLYPEKALDEMKRVLKPNGIVVIATFKDAKLNLMAKLADITSDSYWGFKTARHSKKSMERMMSNRFKNVNIKIYPGGTSLLNAMGIRFLIVSARK